MKELVMFKRPMDALNCWIICTFLVNLLEWTLCPISSRAINEYLPFLWLTGFSLSNKVMKIVAMKLFDVQQIRRFSLKHKLLLNGILKGIDLAGLILFIAFESFEILLISNIFDSFGWCFVQNAGKEQRNAIFSGPLLSKINRRLNVFEIYASIIGSVIILFISYFIGTNKISIMNVFIAELIMFLFETPAQIIYSVAGEIGTKKIRKKEGW